MVPQMVALKAERNLLLKISLLIFSISRNSFEVVRNYFCIWIWSRIRMYFLKCLMSCLPLFIFGTRSLNWTRYVNLLCLVEHVCNYSPCCRVSIPRSTLMPAYKYKAHCRKSFEPADSLALPSVSWGLLAHTDCTTQTGHCYSTTRKGNKGLVPHPQHSFHWNFWGEWWMISGLCVVVGEVLIWIADTARKAVCARFWVHTFI